MRSNYQLPAGVGYTTTPGSPGQPDISIACRVPLGVAGDWLAALVSGKADKLITPEEREHFERVYARCDYLSAQLEAIGTMQINQRKIYDAQARGEPMPNVCLSESELYVRREPLMGELISLYGGQHAKLREIWQRVKPLATDWIEAADKAESELFLAHGVQPLGLLREALTHALRTLDGKPDWQAPAPHPIAALAPLGIHIVAKASKP